MGKNTLNEMPLSRAEVEKLRGEDVFRWAEELLQKSLYGTDPKGKEVEGEIVRVQPFTGNKKGGYEDKTFSESQRSQGETLILFYHNSPQLFIVVDPLSQKIVWIRELNMGGKKVTFSKFLEALGMTRKSLGDRYNGEIQKKFDGVQAWSDNYQGSLKIGDPASGASRVQGEIKRLVTDLNEYSLGEFRKG